MIRVDPILDKSVRGLCGLPYELHPKGCPNVGKSPRCPPKAPLFEDFFDLTSPVFAIVNEFNLGAHARKMLEKHPGWSERQTRCVLYWQGTARKQLREKIAAVLPYLEGYEATWCPEGMGVNVTQTLNNAGITLEWPPIEIARQVAFIGRVR